MGLKSASLPDLYAVWSVLFTIGLTIPAFFAAPNDLKSIGTYVSVAVGCAQALAAVFASVTYVVIQVAP